MHPEIDSDCTATYSDSLRVQSNWPIDVMICSRESTNKRYDVGVSIKDALAHEVSASGRCAYPVLTRGQHGSLSELGRVLFLDAIM